MEGLRKTSETLGQDICRGQDSECAPSGRNSKSVIMTPLHLVTFLVYFSNILCKQMQTYLKAMSPSGKCILLVIIRQNTSKIFGIEFSRKLGKYMKITFIVALCIMESIYCSFTNNCTFY